MDDIPYLQGLCVPDFHGLVKGTGDKHACVIRIPLDCLDTEFVDMSIRPKFKKKKKVIHNFIDTDYCLNSGDLRPIMFEIQKYNSAPAQ